MIRLIGDIHGDLNYYFSVVESSPYNTIQLGDFGIGFLTKDQENSLRNFWKEREIKGFFDRFIRGNHDNPRRCQAFFPNFIEDGSILHIENFPTLCVGGAYSIDKEFRTPEVNYWSDEECSPKKLEEIYQRVKSFSEISKSPINILSHDGPEDVAYEMFIKNGESLLGNRKITTNTSLALQEFAFLLQPKFQFFGHWHISKTFTSKTTKYVCVGEKEVHDFNGEF